ncbi:hypothetical protein DFH08DRAFT_816737 [Mycena albidolilacea]|uniref:Uncharacterized protein n=1 Tax=Mycena albidolilacea TaxID=1033008 RepID=A0AAD6ZL76_9AGAR|nr:hypothetical protein DFH08DRAFT_816737 [Mycena albidolilacea]
MSSTVSLCLRAPAFFIHPELHLAAVPGRFQILAYIIAAAQDATDRRALRELRHQATPPSHLAPLSSSRLLPRSPAALLVSLISPTPPFVSPPSSVETPHDSERWSLTPSARAKPHQATSAHVRRPSVVAARVASSPPFSPLLSLPPISPAPARRRPPSTLRPCPHPERKPGRRSRLSDAQVNGRRALTDRRSPDGYATPGPPSRPPRRPAVFRAPPLHLLAEKTTTTDSAHPTTTTTNSITEGPRREDQEPADLRTLSSVARRDALPGSGRAFDSRGVGWAALVGVCFWCEGCSVVYCRRTLCPSASSSFLGATFAPRLHGPHARPHPDTPLEPSGTPRRQGSSPTGTDAHNALTPTTHSRPQRTHARMATTALLSPRPQQTDAPTPRQDKRSFKIRVVYRGGELFVDSAMHRAVLMPFDGTGSSESCFLPSRLIVQSRPAVGIRAQYSVSGGTEEDTGPLGPSVALKSRTYRFQFHSGQTGRKTKTSGSSE